ncbi:hypothetical protein SDC9_190121 [bioreactor metagenome]|uniref:Uncharacterized protein n=1 Tax=bioreactor metagenome TaxID=1076179 RepID=A0A645I271_9ZZZZ
MALVRATADGRLPQDLDASRLQVVDGLVEIVHIERQVEPADVAVEWLLLVASIELVLEDLEVGAIAQPVVPVTESRTVIDIDMLRQPGAAL